MKFKSYLDAGYPLLWVQTHEEGRAMARLAKDSGGYAVWSWDIITGLKEYATGTVRPLAVPMKAVEAATQMPEGSILFLKDFHRFINSIEVVRTIKNCVPTLKDNDKHIVILSPVVQIPIELEKDITVYNFGLPDMDDLMLVTRNIIKRNEENLKGITVNEKAIKASKGLTLQEAENAIALSLVETRGFDQDIITSQKLQAIKKSGLMELFEPMPESELGGMARLKAWLHNRVKGFEDPKFPAPKMIVLVGLPGGGKSLSAKVVASVLAFPLLRFDFSGMKASHVGESEQKLRQACAVIDAVAPAVIWMDEIEKAMGGAQSSNRTDGGTTSAMLGYFLTWLEESKSTKFIVATCNDIGDLLALSQGALLRSGRCDAIFFVDLPNREERVEILHIMNRRYKTDYPDEIVDRMENWTGAEIEAFVKDSLYDGVEEALANIKPVYLKNQENIEAARQWAKFNARMANSNGKTETKGRRIKV